MLDAFINGIKWQTEVDRLERISKITKQDIVDFANKNFLDNNYAVVYKRTGEDKSVRKVDKPDITPVDVDRDNASPFVQAIMRSTPKAIEPKFLDYDTDILKSEIKSKIPLLYTKNNENKLFELYYKFDFGKNNDKVLPVAMKYVQFLGTKDMSAAKVKQELYKLGCTFEVFCDDENTWLKLSGLNENFDPALQLFENILADPIIDETVLYKFKSRYHKRKKRRKATKGYHS